MKKDDGSLQFLLFGGDYYYPNGGWEDLYGSFDSLEEAQQYAKQTKEAGYGKDKGRQIPIFEWYHIVDKNTGERVV